MGAFYYVQVTNPSGQRYNGSAFEAYTEGNWANYDVPLVEQGTSGLHVGDFPALPAGYYGVLTYQRQGGTPAVTDAPPVGSSDWYWTGSALVSAEPPAAEVEPYLTGTVEDATPAADDFTGDTGLPATNLHAEQWLAFTSGALKGVPRKITTYTGATRRFQFSGTGTADDAPFPAAPSDGDAFVIVGHG